jgi:hypothetical protein
LLQQLLTALRLSLSQAITQIFVIAAFMMLVAFVVTLFLREIPLRRSHRPEQSDGVQGGAKAGEPVMAGVRSAPVGEQAVPTLSLQRADNPVPASSVTWATAGVTLATLAREARQPDADPRLLSALSGAMDGRYPSDWTAERRALAVASEILAPLAQALLAADDLRSS